MSDETATYAPDESTDDSGPETGFALALEAEDSGDWEPFVRWLARNPEQAGDAAQFLSDQEKFCTAVGTRPVAPNLFGARLGRFEFKEKLGEGGEGVVYHAFDPNLKRDVAVKMVRAGGAGAANIARFRFEAERVASLEHPNIVRVYESGEDNGAPYLVMPLMAGSLAERLKAPGAGRRLDLEAAELVRDIALGVHHAHQRGLIHRDLKPANILLNNAGVPHVADFGLARAIDVSASGSGNLAGTVPYMAPEQARGEKVLTVAVDVWALGVILFEMLTGRTPFGAGDVPSVLRRIEEEPAPPVREFSPAVSKDLEAICLKCLEKEPARRYASAQELADDLDLFLQGKVPLARLPSIWGKAVRAVLRQQFDKPGAWGWVSVWSGVLVIAYHLFSGWAIAVGLPQRMFVAGGGATVSALLVLYWAILCRRRFRGGDRHALTVMLGLLVASTLLPIVYRPPDDGDLTAYRLSIYPLLALITGVSYLALAYPSWGGYYLVSAGYLVIAVLFKLFPPIGPWVYAVVHGGVMFLVGVYLIRLDRAVEAADTHTNSRGNS